MLSEIAAILQKAGLVNTAWASEMQTRGQLVKLFRQYYEGEHRMKLTAEMRKMMQISDDRMDRYNANYCEMVISALADRLTVDMIEAVDPSPPAPLPQGARGENGKLPAKQENPAQVWVDDLLKANRFDGLQIDVREAVLRDGETFVMSQYDETKQRIMLVHELAWDGDCGVMVVFDRTGREIVAGVKVWYEGDNRRANIYYPNSVERYNYQMQEVTGESGQTENKMVLKMLGDQAEDTTRENQVPGVPIVQFVNKSKKGSSELVNIIPLQDSLNSTLLSAVMNALLTAFSILFANGFQPPSGITPGMIIHSGILNTDGTPFWSESKEIAEAAAALNESYSLERIQPGEVEPLIKQMEFVIKQIGVVSFTPVPGLMGGDSQSGEALQERRVGQLGKVNAAQVRLGNRWEDVIALAHWQQTLFAKEKPPESSGWNCRWKNAEIRNDTNILKLVELLMKWGYEREGFRQLRQLPGITYSDADIDRLITEKQDDSANKMPNPAGQLPDFGGFNLNQ